MQHCSSCFTVGCSYSVSETKFWPLLCSTYCFKLTVIHGSDSHSLWKYSVNPRFHWSEFLNRSWVLIPQNSVQQPEKGLEVKKRFIRTNSFIFFCTYFSLYFIGAVSNVSSRLKPWKMYVPPARCAWQLFKILGRRFHLYIFIKSAFWIWSCRIIILTCASSYLIQIWA